MQQQPLELAVLLKAQLRSPSDVHRGERSALTLQFLIFLGILLEMLGIFMQKLIISLHHFCNFVNEYIPHIGYITLFIVPVPVDT